MMDKVATGSTALMRAPNKRDSIGLVLLMPAIKPCCAHKKVSIPTVNVDIIVPNTA